MHDTRVALRRLRVSLRLFRHHLRRSVRAGPLRADLAWLSGVLGPARDGQVLLARLAVNVAQTCPEDPGAALLLHRFEHRYERETARARLHLTAPRMDALADHLAAFADTRPVPRRIDATALREEHAGDLADLLADLVVLSTGSAGREHDERLHDLRKATKRVRYGHQALAVVAGRPAHDAVQAGLTHLQEVLGEHHDTVVMRAGLAAAAAHDSRLAEVAALLAEREARAADHAESRLPRAVRRLRRATGDLEID